MTRTYVKGRKGFKRKDHKHGHCYVCGYDKKNSYKRKTEIKNLVNSIHEDELDQILKNYKEKQVRNILDIKTTQNKRRIDEE